MNSFFSYRNIIFWLRMVYLFVRNIKMFTSPVVHILSISWEDQKCWTSQQGSQRNMQSYLSGYLCLQCLSSHIDKSVSQMINKTYIKQVSRLQERTVSKAKIFSRISWSKIWKENKKLSYFFEVGKLFKTLWKQRTAK